MRTVGAELIWQGRIQLGDEPGVYGDASYAGLAVELPVTLSQQAVGGASPTLVIQTEGVRTYPPYEGHPVSAVLYQDGSETVIGTASIACESDEVPSVDTEVSVDLSAAGRTAFVGVRVHVDGKVPPGLYDDFVLTRVELRAPDAAVFGELGFHV